MIGFGGLQLHRYKQRVLTRRQHLGVTGPLAVSTENDYHLVKLFVVGAGGRGGGGQFGNQWSGYGAGGGGEVAIGQYQVNPLISTSYACTMGNQGADSSCVFHDDVLGASRTVLANGGANVGAGSKPGGAGGTGGTGQQNFPGGRGGNGAGRGGGGGAIGGAAGQNSTAGRGGACGRGATGINVGGIGTEMSFWGLGIGAGGNCGQNGSGDGGRGSGGGGCGGLPASGNRGFAGDGGAVGGGGGGALNANSSQANARVPGNGGAGHVFIIY